MTFPYSFKDFSADIVTEKDISLIEEMMKDSYDYKISYTHLDKKDGYKGNAFYLTDVSKYLPVF